MESLKCSERFRNLVFIRTVEFALSVGTGRIVLKELLDEGKDYEECRMAFWIIILCFACVHFSVNSFEFSCELRDRDEMRGILSRNWQGR